MMRVSLLADLQIKQQRVCVIMFYSVACYPTGAFYKQLGTNIS